MYEGPLFLIDFLNYMETIKGKSSQTVKEYYYDLRTFLRYLKYDKNNQTDAVPDHELSITDLSIDVIRQVTLSDLYAYMSWLSRKKNNSASARSRKVASIRSFFKYLTDKAAMIDFNPTLELESPKITKKLPRYLNIEESLSLLNRVDGSNKERDFAIITLFLNCGMRLSELVSIDMGNIKSDTLTVIGKGNKERTIYLNDACMEALSDYLKIRPAVGLSDPHALFLSSRKKRISKNSVHYIVKKFITLSGLDPNKYSAHKLRHTAATLMYKYGKVDIRALQEILGHESIATTEIYTHVDNEQIKKAVASNPLAQFEKKD